MIGNMLGQVLALRVVTPGEVLGQMAIGGVLAIIAYGYYQYRKRRNGG